MNYSPDFIVSGVSFLGFLIGVFGVNIGPAWLYALVLAIIFFFTGMNDKHGDN